MSLLKLFRIGIVFASWVIMVTTIKDNQELFRTSIIFFLGLTYDYLCLYNNSKPKTYQRRLSVITLGYMFFLGMISFFGLSGILVQDPVNQNLIVMKKDVIMLSSISFTRETFGWGVLILCILIGLEFSNPLERKQITNESI